MLLLRLAISARTYILGSGYDIFEIHKILMGIVTHSKDACANCGHTRASKFAGSACETAYLSTIERGGRPASSLRTFYSCMRAQGEV